MTATFHGKHKAPPQCNRAWDAYGELGTDQALPLPVPLRNQPPTETSEFDAHRVGLSHETTVVRLGATHDHPLEGRHPGSTQTEPLPTPTRLSSERQPPWRSCQTMPTSGDTRRLRKKLNAPIKPCAPTHVGPHMPHVKGSRAISAANSDKRGAISVLTDSLSADHPGLH